jgi:hypothetical protein
MDMCPKASTRLCWWRMWFARIRRRRPWWREAGRVSVAMVGDREVFEG